MADGPKRWKGTRRLPIAPFVELIERLAYNVENVHELVGVDERTLWGYRNGRNKRVDWLTADRVLTATNRYWGDVWDPETYPELYEEKRP